MVFDDGGRGVGSIHKVRRGGLLPSVHSSKALGFSHFFRGIIIVIVIVVHCLF